MHLQHGAIALRLCSQLLNLLLILLERLSLLKACFVLGSVLPVPQLKRTLCNSFPQVFLKTKNGGAVEREEGGVCESCAAATCGMCCERHPTQTLPILLQPACLPLYSSQTLALQPAESCSSKVDLHHHHTSHVTRHTSQACAPESRHHRTEGRLTNQTSVVANRPRGNLDLRQTIQNSGTIA